MQNYTLGLINVAAAAIYAKTHQLIEKLCEILYIVIAQATPAIWIVPKCFGSLFFYLTTDLGNDAFELPLPMW